MSAAPADHQPHPAPIGRRQLLQASGVVAAATALTVTGSPWAHAATPNCLQIGATTAAFARTAMSPVSGSFRVSLDYRYEAGTPMSNYYVFASYDGTAYRGPRIIQTGSALTILIGSTSYPLAATISSGVWHRIVLEFSPTSMTMFIDGIRQSSGATHQFPIPLGTTFTHVGYLGDISGNAAYTGTGYFDNLLVVSSGTTTFSKQFDDDAAPGWTDMVVQGTGTVGLASPARNSDVGPMVTAAMDAPAAATTGVAFTVRATGQDASGRGVLVEAGSVTLGSLPAGVTAAPEPGGYFTVTASQPGTITLTATVQQDGQMIPVSDAVTVTAPVPSSVDLTIPISPVFVGDTTQLDRRVSGTGGTDIDPADLTWTFTSSAPSVATVSGQGLVTAIAAGTTTITATGTQGSVQVTDTVQVPVAALTTLKTRASYWTTARRGAAASNAATHPWAATQRDAAIDSADLVIAQGYPALWAMVTSQNLPRSYSFTSREQDGCLNCGTDVIPFGTYPYLADTAAKPWKLTCPSCSFDFPTNNFAAYYTGGLDHNGYFSNRRAKRHNDALIAAGGPGNLVNTAHPAKGPTWGVDDGTGYLLPSGARYTPIAYYNHWKLWYTGDISTNLRILRDAYIYTGEAKYASAGIVILDRIADVYPALSIEAWPTSAGYLNNGYNRGRAVGSIWETLLATDLVLAYDAFFPALADGAAAPVSTAALSFLDGASRLMDKSNVKRIRRNIEDGLVKQILPAIQRGDIRGNTGMHQATLAAAAVTIDHVPETRDWLAFDFATGTTEVTAITGGNVSALLVNDVDRDGCGNEAAPAYNSIWLSQLSTMADLLDGYALTGVPNYDLYGHPKFLKLFDGVHPITQLGTYTPNIGDSGSAGNPGLSLDIAAMLKAFQRTGRPVYAQVAHWLNGRSSFGLRLTVFDAQPEQIATDVQDIVDQHGEWQPPADMLTGYGFAALRDGALPPAPPTPLYQAMFDSLEITNQTAPTTYDTAGSYLKFNARTSGDTITFQFTLPSALSTHLHLDIAERSTFGSYRVELDGVTIAPSFSFQTSSSNRRDLGAVTLAAGPHQVTFTLLGSSGSAGLRSLKLAAAQSLGYGTQRATTMYFGRNTGHGHRDALNLNLYAFGLNLLPDLGYPRYTSASDMHRFSLVRNTISHNTVVVDHAAQADVVVGTPHLFDGGPNLQMVDISVPSAYPQTTRYRRTALQVRIDDENFYLIDMFRLQGGSEYLYSFHGPDASTVTAVANGVAPTPQKDGGGNYIGTYAGPNVPYDDTVNDPTGHSYFFDVDRTTGNYGNITATWTGVKDTWGMYGTPGAATDVTLRLNLVGGYSDVAMASCQPPQNKPGNPAELRYLLARATIQSGGSIMTGLIEAYRGSRVVQGFGSVPVTTLTGAAASAYTWRAMRVTLPGGRVDTVVHSLDPTQTVLVDGIRFQGSCGLITTRPGQPTTVQLVDGTEYGPVTGRLAALTGTVTTFTSTLSATNTITVALQAGQTSQITQGDVLNRYIYVTDDGQRNAVYRITAVDAWTSTTATLSIDNVTPIRSYLNSSDFSQGFTYDLAAGRSFRIPLRHS